jgi:hypothetical protein
VSVLLFVLAECPIANRLAPEMNAIEAAYRPKGARFYLVHADRKIISAAAKRHAQEFGYRMPVLLDPGHRLVSAAGAERTPEAAVFRDGKLMYRGRINDLYGDLGRSRPQPTRHDLRRALDLALEGKPVPQPWPASVGCVIDRD